MKVSVKEKSWLAKAAAFKLRQKKVAIVFHKTIHLHRTTKAEFLADTDWVCHELQHIQQYREHGTIGFIFKYLWDSMLNGYHNNKFEKDARANEKNIALLKKFEIR